jgi:transcriptional regulator with XRE-family HTH domain
VFASEPVTVAGAFAALLRNARREAGLTQEALANLSGLDRTTISQAELAKASPQLETLIRLAGALGREPSELIPKVRWEPPATFKRPEGQFK